MTLTIHQLCQLPTEREARDNADLNAIWDEVVENARRRGVDLERRPEPGEWGHPLLKLGIRLRTGLTGLPGDPRWAVLPILRELRDHLRQGLVAVSDGTCVWTVQREDLVGALGRHGWTERLDYGAVIWDEPASAAGGSPYQDICDELDPVHNDSDGDEIPEDLPEFCFRPDFGRGTWTLDPAP